MKPTSIQQKHRGTASVQFRFLVCIAMASSIFILVMIVLNLLFFQKYYLMQKRSQLKNIYRVINYEYSNNKNIQIDELQELEQENNIRISIIDAYGKSVYDTIYQHDRDKFFMPNHDPFNESVYIYNAQELQQKGYTFSKLHEYNGRIVYLALVGKVGEDGMMLLRIPTAALEDDQSVNFIFLIFSAVIALIACLISGFFIGKSFTRPIREMTEVANSVAKLEFSKRCSSNSNDEFGELGRSLNQMSDYLESAIQDMQRMNEQLQKEIEEKQQIDDMRREFIINISHDLKTPIALIQGYAEGLRIGINESEEDKNYYCDIIIDEAKRMNELVRQLLDLSRIELGNTVPTMTEFDAYELMEAVVSKTAVMWQEKNLHVDVSGIGEQSLYADYDLLERAVMNYMTNAIDHTPEHGTIWLKTAEDAKHILVSVENQGEPLAEEEMNKIWDKFYKLDKSRTRVSGGGSGIGLSIVKAILHAHHGSCGVHNTIHGVEFYLSLLKNTEA